MVWRGDVALHEVKQGMKKKILETPLGHPDLVQPFLRATTETDAVLLGSVPAVPDMQSARLVLLFFALTKANYLVRATSPAVTQEFEPRAPTDLQEMFRLRTLKFEVSSNFDLQRLKIELRG